jgi:glycosyltransferase involved in cell wall biosynthesis
MKVLHLITRLILGGAQENTVLTCEGLAARGHEVTLAFGPIYGPEGSLLQRARRGGYELVELPSMIRSIRPWTDLRCYHQCRALIRRFKPDVVHTHSSKAGILGRAAAWGEGVPAVIHTIHGLPFHPYQSPVVRRLYITAERWAARRCHAIATVADAMTRQALAAGVGSPDQYTTVYSGMEIEPFLDCPIDRAAIRAELGLREDDIVLGAVARLAELKGHDDLLDALGGTMRGQPQLRLLWVGDGWWRGRLEEKIRRMSLQDRVVIAGLVPPDRIPAMMRAMDVLIHPSYREGLARALPQALLSGVPVISYDCDGAAEVCIDGQTGRLVPTGDLTALREAVRWMLEHPAQRQAMGQRGRDLCTPRFSHHTMVEQLEALYGKVLGSASTNPAAPSARCR